MQLEKLRFRPNTKGIVSCLALVTFLLSFLFMAMPGTAIAKSEDSSAATEFVVNINDGGIIIPVHTYTIEEMQELTSDKVVYYSSIDSMPAPNITIAKGVTLDALVADINQKYNANVTISPTTLKNIKLYASDGWTSNYSHDYLYGATRYYYPELVNKWDEDNQKTGPGSDANPVVVEPIFATYSYQARFLTGLDPSQMLGPTDEGSTTFRFCFGQTENELTSNTITNSRFGRWVNRMDIVLPPQADAPEVALDPNTKLGEDVVLTFEDNQTWREAIGDLIIGGTTSIYDDPTKYKVEPGKITLDSSLFPQDKLYKIEIKARGFNSVVLWQQKDGMPSPVLSPDTTHCILGQTEPVTITFEDDPAWREAIYDLTVRTLSKEGLYEITPGAIKIQASAFTGVGKSTIVVKADKYKDATIDQYMKLKPPVLTATPITIGEDATIIFTDDYSWRTYIDTITANGTKLNKDTDYTVTTGKLTIKAAVFKEPGEYNIVITNRGNYVDATVTQTVNAPGLSTPPELIADSTNNTVGTPIEITFTDDETWRNAITEVKVGDTVLESSQYTKAEGKITIDADVFTTAGTYTIAIKATGYEDANITQIINEAKPQYTVTPVEDTAYTIDTTSDGISTMTVNSGVEGIKYFAVKVKPVIPHDGMESVVFKHSKNDEQLSLNVTRADFDTVDAAQAGFNVLPSDIIKAYIVDELTNAKDWNPTILQ